MERPDAALMCSRNVGAGNEVLRKKPLLPERGGTFPRNNNCLMESENSGREFSNFRPPGLAFPRRETRPGTNKDMADGVTGIKDAIDKKNAKMFPSASPRYPHALSPTTD